MQIKYEYNGSEPLLEGGKGLKGFWGWGRRIEMIKRDVKEGDRGKSSRSPYLSLSVSLSPSLPLSRARLNFDARL
jgi:hypothetical protein